MARYGILVSLLFIVILLCTSGTSNIIEASSPHVLSEIPAPLLNPDSLQKGEPEGTKAPDASAFPGETKSPEVTVMHASSPDPALPADNPPAPTPTTAPMANQEASQAENKDCYSNDYIGLNVPILMYHNLLAGNIKGDGLNVSEKAFEDQIKNLKEHGYNGITFGNLYDHYINEAPLPENPVIITFDDGYISNYTIGYPILMKYNMKACIFVITDSIGNSNYLNKSEIREMSSSGIIDIQSHSVSHSYSLSAMKKERLIKELADSKTILEDLTGNPVNIFCYPYGKYSQGVIEELRNQGYIFAVTTKHGCASKKSNPLLLPRIRVNGTDSGKDLKSRIENLTGRRTKFIGIPEPSPPDTSPTPVPDMDQVPETTPTVPPSDDLDTPTPEPDAAPPQPTEMTQDFAPENASET